MAGTIVILSGLQTLHQTRGGSVNLGKVGLTAAALARMLAEFGITSANRRWPDGGQSKGYRVEDFADSWARYCPPTGSGAQPSQSVPGRPGASATPAVCITCRNLLSYDDGTHTHPTCTTLTSGRN